MACIFAGSPPNFCENLPLDKSQEFDYNGDVFRNSRNEVKACIIKDIFNR